MAEETGWLIEQPEQGTRGPAYVGIVGFFNGEQGGGELVWTVEPNHALRFARKEDAAKFAGMIRQLAEHLPHSQTVPFLRSGDPAPRVCDHIWMDTKA